MSIDYPDWATAEHHALAIFNQKVPLARSPAGVGMGSNTLAASGVTDLVTGAVFTQPSFQMLVGFEYTSAAATIPFGVLKFQWTDTNSGFTVDPDWCTLVGGFAGLNFVFITGPARADTLTVELDNLDPAQILTYSFGISQTSHVYDEFRIQEVGQVTPPVFTRAGQNNQMGILGSVGVLLGAGGSATRLASAWGGKAILSSNNQASTAAVFVQLLDPGIVAGGSPLYGTANAGIIASMDVPGVAPVSQEVALPYGPVLIREINGNAGAAQTPTTTLVRSR